MASAIDTRIPFALANLRRELKCKILRSAHPFRIVNFVLMQLFLTVYFSTNESSRAWSSTKVGNSDLRLVVRVAPIQKPVAGCSTPPPHLLLVPLPPLGLGEMEDKAKNNYAFPSQQEHVGGF
ncbi:hypothetical protein TcWFU_004703 [Taenia crassiceps]|uniref:Uncharacterized protein n=1 Tax=Taenia crassiceps TaxID=6207 RepID=A0ABR4QR26_9CEST